MRKFPLVTLTATLALQALTSIASATANTPHSKAQLCSLAKDISSFQKLLDDPNNQIGFQNQGGLGNGGVCWWYSRLERNATYLAIYQPGLTPPSQSEASAIIAKLRDGNGFVVIPGYANLRSFSLDFADQFQSVLNDWQVSDGVFAGGWMDGLGSDTTNPNEIQTTMNQTYDLVVNKHRVVEQILKLSGVESHAWLVIGMSKTPRSYLMNVVDSNFPGQVKLEQYVIGQSSMSYYDVGPMVPQLKSSYDNENEALLATLRQSCGR